MSTRTRLRPHRVDPPPPNGNGQHYSTPPPVAASAFRRIEVWLRPKFEDEQSEQEWPDDWLFCLWKNHPIGLRRRFYGFDGGDDVDIYTALTQLVIAHNGWTYMDHRGEIVPYPPASEPAFWDRLPNEVAWAIRYAITDETSRALPNFLTRMSGTSSSTSSSSSPEETPPATSSPGLTSEAS